MKMKRRYKKFLKLLIDNLLITRNKGCIFFTDIFLTLGSRLILVAQQGNGSRNYYYYFTLKSCFPDADNRFNKWVSILLELGLKDRIENEN